MATEILIDGVVGLDVTSGGVRAQLSKAEGDITVFVNSPGGVVHEGLSIHNQLRAYDKGTVAVVIDGVAASIASVIAVAGDTVTMAKGTQFMIHPPWTVAVGEAHNMQQAIAGLTAAAGSITAAYGHRVKDEALIAAWLQPNAETWLTAEESVAAGLADVAEDHVTKAIKPVVPRGQFKHTPAEFETEETAADLEAKFSVAEALNRTLDIARRRPR